MDETSTPEQARRLQNGLIARAVEDELLLPIVLYKAAATAGIADRSSMTRDELMRALGA